MELLLIRHGLPVREENPDGRPADPPLSEEGRDQAERAARWLAGEPIEAIYTSPLRRAQETAAPLERQRGLSAQVEPGVIELDHREPSYVPLEELKATDYPAWQEQMRDFVEGDAAEFRAVVVEALERIIAAHPGGRVAVTCHGGVINAWASHVLGVERVFLFEPFYTGLNRFRASRSGHRSVVSLNEAAHLRGER
jgi:probable phosphoglycerate mutase